MSEETTHFVNGDQDYTMEEAFAEANRCLNCPKPLCRTGCPIENEIPRFIKAIAAGNIGLANEIIGEHSNLPSICGRVCPREKQCEGHCILNRANKPINIGKLERFAADFQNTYNLSKLKPIRKTEAKIAIIGSGPAGITVAYDLVQRGYDVTIFERSDEPGGILVYGIPEFRLSKEIVQKEFEKLRTLGVKIECGVEIGPERTLDDLKAEGFEGVFIGTGTHTSSAISLDGDDKAEIFQAMDLLTAVQMHKEGKLDASHIPVSKGDRVVIIGAGNVAIDAARTSLRQGATSVTMAYRRGEANMPCNPSEYAEALEEGVKFEFYNSPKEVLGSGHVEALRCEISEVDEEGNIIPTGKMNDIPADKIILAIGHKPRRMLRSTGNMIDCNEEGYIITQDEPYYGMTNREGVFAAGDVVHKPATVVLAMAEAKKVATGMFSYFENKKIMDEIDKG